MSIEYKAVADIPVSKVSVLRPELESMGVDPSSISYAVECGAGLRVDQKVFVNDTVGSFMETIAATEAMQGCGIKFIGDVDAARRIRDILFQRAFLVNRVLVGGWFNRTRWWIASRIV